MAAMSVVVALSRSFLASGVPAPKQASFSESQAGALFSSHHHHGNARLSHFLGNLNPASSLSYREGNPTEA